MCSSRHSTLHGLGFERVIAKETGRPSYHPAVLRLKQEMSRLEVLDARMRNTPDQQISLTDPDARSMATSGRGSGVVGYNVQVAVDTEHHLIVTHEVINVGNDRGQLARMSRRSKSWQTAAITMARRSGPARKPTSR